jgi:uroporphyrinogen decarboxylase
MELTHKERIERILEGKEVDRPAVSAWRHFYHRENTRGDLVEAMIEFQQKFDWDFMKINPRASYHIEDWGAVLQKSNDPLVKPRTISLPIAHASDWAKIKRLPVKSGALGENLAANAKIVDLMETDVHCLATIFSPLSIAGDLVNGDDKFVELLRSHPDELHTALGAITETFTKFVRELLSAGVAGVFFATTEWASRNMLTEEEYLEFGKPYDLHVLDAASPAPFNVIHVCSKNNMLPLFRDYPAQVLSWNPFDEGNLSIHQAAQIFDKVFLAGMDHNITLKEGPPETVKQQIESSLIEAPRGRLIVGPGCAVKVSTPDDNLRVAAETVKNWKSL